MQCSVCSSKSFLLVGVCALMGYPWCVLSAVYCVKLGMILFHQGSRSFRSGCSFHPASLSSLYTKRCYIGTGFWPPLLLVSAGGTDRKESPCNAGDPGSIPGLGRSPGGRNGNPLQYTCLENSMDRRAWQALGGLHGVAKSQT